MIEMGRKLNGRYKIIGTIGSGGMANVYLAHDLILGRDVAVKVLRFDFQNDKDAIRRFQREALASTELVHPNIVSVYDVGEDDGMQFIVMEYVKGTDLKRFIQTQYPIPYTTVVAIMKQILSAMSLAHQHRIIHRDLKPQNILINEAGDVKITDFGIAIALSETSITQTNTLLGSVHYLSPEQARGSMATKQSDIYSMGVVLYELLSGRVPFEGESAVSIALKHFQEEMPSLRLSNPGIPQALENVVMHATAKEPLDRYASAEEMEADISTALSPARMHEAPFKPQAMLNETKVLRPVSGFKPRDSENSDKLERSQEIKISPNPLKTSSPKQANQREEAPQNKNSKKGLLVIGAVLVVAVVAVFFLFFTAPNEVAVPDVKGQSQAAATQLIEAVKLKVATNIEELADDTVEAGQVVKTKPAIGDKVKEGSTVTLFVSTGKKTSSMVSVVGVSKAAAKTKLLDQGFLEKNITIKEEYNSDVETGEVISQTPEPGEDVVPETTKVTLVVSKGLETIKVPNVIGLSQNAAEELILAAGLTPSVSEDYSDSVSEGLVISSTPQKNAEVEKGDMVELVISKGPEKTTTTTTTTSTTKEETSSSFPLTISIPSDASSAEPNRAIYDVYYADADSNYEYTKYNTDKITFAQLQNGYAIGSIRITGDQGAKVKITEEGITIYEKADIIAKQDLIVRFQ